MADDLPQEAPPKEPLPEATAEPEAPAQESLPEAPPEQDIEHELLHGARPIISDEPEALEAFDRLKKLASVQAGIIVGLGLLLVLAVPFTRPVYLYNAMNPEKRLSPLVSLSAPNMTNRAVLAWATTSITEVLTMGFGDMDERLPLQENKFTPKGWKQFIKTFSELELYETFKQKQLVLTTVPSNTPVVLRQGLNVNGEHQWDVQMPVIMTFATNNNIMRSEQSYVTLEIVRVSTNKNPWGIAIQSWRMQ